MYQNFSLHVKDESKGSNMVQGGLEVVLNLETREKMKQRNRKWSINLINFLKNGRFGNEKQFFPRGGLRF